MLLPIHQSGQALVAPEKNTSKTSKLDAIQTRLLWMMNSCTTVGHPGLSSDLPPAASLPPLALDATQSYLQY